MIRRLFFTLAAAMLLAGAIPAIAQHDNDLRFGIVDNQLVVRQPPNFEAPKIMYFDGVLYIRDQGVDFYVAPGTSFYQLSQMTWQQMSITPGLIGGTRFGGSYSGQLTLKSTGPHLHIPFNAVAPGTYIMRSYLKDGTARDGSPVKDSEPFTMIWVAGSNYAQVDLSLLYNLPDTPPGFPDAGFAGVDIDGLVVSAVDAFEGGFYAQSESRSCGVFVRSSEPVAPGARIRVKGILSTVGGERAITAHAITKTSGVAPRPLAMSIRALGGKAPGKYTPGTQGGTGLSTTGALVRVAGIVRYHGEIACIDDGSPIYRAPGIRGIRIATETLDWENSITLPDDGKPAVITGISGSEEDAGQIHRVIRPRGQADIRIL